MSSILQNFDPILLASMLGSLLLFALLFIVSQISTNKSSRKNVKKRLTLSDDVNALKGHEKSQRKTTEDKKISKKIVKKANDFYASTDPTNIKKTRMLLLQAGFMQPNAVGYFIAARFASAVISAVIACVLIFFLYWEESTSYKIVVTTFIIAAGYFIPNVYISRRVKKIETLNRQGFPDILDLMVVSAEAGLTMEASIERISAELKHIYPHLSAQLNMASLEIRAGRPIDQALRAFGERLSLEEVKGFATMIQQAKELGTSVSDALRVYSDEMRHKRMMKAEEKAYALPAKMSVPVTLFILPIVIGIAIVPTIVRLNM